MGKTCTEIALLMGLALASAAGCGKSDANGQSSTPSGDSAQAATTASIAGSPAQPQADPLHPVVVMETSLGSLTIKLNAEKAPISVDNFLQYVNEHFYDQTIVHQVFPGQCWLAGGFGTDLTEKQSRSGIRNEADNGLKNRRGTIAMVRAVDVIDSARSQFFVNIADNEMLDYRDRTPQGYGYCVFGEVTAGLDVVDRIANAPLHDTPQMERTPASPIVIKSIRLAR